MKWLLKDKAPFSNGQTHPQVNGQLTVIQCFRMTFSGDGQCIRPSLGTVQYTAELNGRTPLIQEQMWRRKMRWATRTVPSLGTVSVLLFHFKKRQVLQQPVQSCIFPLFNTSDVCDYTAHHAALRLKFKVITRMTNSVFSLQQWLNISQMAQSFNASFATAVSLI